MARGAREHAPHPRCSFERPQAETVNVCRIRYDSEQMRHIAPRSSGMALAHRERSSGQIVCRTALQAEAPVPPERTYRDT
jgi:hypothetical protein